MIGKTLGHYRIVEKIGAGGMGEVYRAHDEHLNRDVAIKVLPEGTLADESARKRFRKEAEALSKLNHSHIAVVHDFDTQGGLDFLVMEYIPGVTLSEKLASGPLGEAEISRLGAQLADGLATAHEQGVVHRDLKPGNLRLTPDGRIKILDFGLARLLRPPRDADLTASVTETQAMTGTLPYMAPEQLRGEPADARTDIHAVGTVLYEMATGQRPFPATLATALAADIQTKLPEPPRALNPRLSAELERIILKCLEKDPSNRYQSAKELGVDLRRSAAPSPGVRAEAPGIRAWRPWQIAAAFGAVGMLLALLVNLDRVRARWSPTTRAPRIQSLAVLPLVNQTGDPEQEYFVDGMTEALILELSKIKALKVISRTSVMQYKGTRKPLPEIARELKVDGVVEGSVQRARERVRVTAQLIHAATDQHLWAENYDRDLRDILALYSDVARAIAAEIRATLTPEERARLTAVRSVDPEAHSLYLQGRFHWNKRSPEGFEKAVHFFQQAIEKDPSYPPAYSGLADSYSLLGYFGFRGISAREAYPRAMAAARKAVELDESSAEAHTSLGFALYRYEWDWPGAERELRRAIELNPGYPTAHQWYAVLLMSLGRQEEAYREILRAQELDPVSAIITAVVGLHFHYVRDYDRSLEWNRKTLELDPNFTIAFLNRGRNYLQKRMYDRAIAEMRKAVEISGANLFYLGFLGHAYGVAGQKSEARKILEQFKRESRPGYLSYQIAEIYLGLGEREQALAWLAKAVEERSAWLVYLKVEPKLDPLRSDPRFQALLRRMNFPE